MIRKIKWTLMLLALCVGLYVSNASLSASTAAGPHEETARLVARQLPRLHMTRKPCDDEVAQAALDLFLDTLDYERSYFLASDVAAFRERMKTLDDELRGGRVDFALDVYAVLRERASNRVDYVEQLLRDGFDFTADETYEWKRKDAKWPEGEAEWNELWRKKVKNQYLTRLVAIARDAAETNATAKAADAGAKPAETNAAAAADLKLTPEEWVRKAYRQYLTVINDNDDEWVLEQYLTAFARAYDPHTDYMSASNVEDFDIGMKLSLTGIGAMLTTEDGAAKIDRLITGGPADLDGRLKAGDKIIAVAQGDGEPVDVLHWPLRKTVRLIRGEKGTKVVLTVIRASDPTGATIERIDIIRDEVRLEDQAARTDIREVPGADGATQRVAVITLPEFYADMKPDASGKAEPRTSSHDVRRLLGELRTQDVAGVILDLRNNGGGLLSEAIEMTGLFIESGPVVQVYNRGATRVLTDDDPETVYGGPLVVLVSRQTASASEILAGALQDYGRAVIVGDSKTHGKGTVQSLVPLHNDKPALGTLKVTTATFYRIDGGSTQLRGIVPDVALPSPFDSLEVGEEHLPHALPWTKVFPALYRRATDLDAYLPALKEQSEKRQKEDPRYLAYFDLLNRLAERQRTKTISLNMEERLSLSREEQALQKLIEETDPEGPASDDKKKGDIALTEAARILADLVALQSRQAKEKMIADKPVAPAPAAN